MKSRFRDIFLPFVPLLHCFAIVIATFLLVIVPVACVIMNLKTLGIFWLPVLLLYWLFLSVASRQVIVYREIMQERYLYGDDELFFEVYPHFKRIEDRGKRFAERRKRLRARLKTLRARFFP